MEFEYFELEEPKAPPVEFEFFDLESPGFIDSAKRGVDELQASLYGAGALASSSLGFTKARDWFMDGYRANIEEAEEYAPTVRLKDIDSVKDFGTWAIETGGALIPSMAEAAVGAAVGSLVAPGPGSVAGGVAGRTVLKKGIDRIVKKGIATEVGKKLGEKKLREEVTKQALKKLGAKVGVGAAVLPMEAGGNYGDLLNNHGVDAPLSSLAFGAVATSLEFLGGNIRLIDSFFGPAASSSIKNALSSKNGHVLKRAAINILAGSSSEAMQESGQELLSVLNVVANTDEKLLTSENAWALLESGAAGALAGTAGGVARSAFGRHDQADEDEVGDISPVIDETVKTDLLNTIKADVENGVAQADDILAAYDGGLLDEYGVSKDEVIEAIGSAKEITTEPEPETEFFELEEPEKDVQAQFPSVDYISDEEAKEFEQEALLEKYQPSTPESKGKQLLDLLAKEEFEKPLAPDDLINGITRDIAGDMLAAGDEEVLLHIREGMEKHGKRVIEDAIINQEMKEIASVPKEKRKAVRERIAKLRPKIDAILQGKEEPETIEEESFNKIAQEFNEKHGTNLEYEGVFPDADGEFLGHQFTDRNEEGPTRGTSFLVGEESLSLESLEKAHETKAQEFRTAEKEDISSDLEAKEDTAHLTAKEILKDFAKITGDARVVREYLAEHGEDPTPQYVQGKIGGHIEKAKSLIRNNGTNYWKWRSERVALDKTNDPEAGTVGEYLWEVSQRKKSPTEPITRESFAHKLKTEGQAEAPDGAMYIVKKPKGKTGYYFGKTEGNFVTEKGGDPRGSGWTIMEARRKAEEEAFGRETQEEKSETGRLWNSLDTESRVKWVKEFESVNPEYIASISWANLSPANRENLEATTDQKKEPQVNIEEVGAIVSAVKQDLDANAKLKENIANSDEQNGEIAFKAAYRKALSKVGLDVVRQGKATGPAYDHVSSSQEDRAAKIYQRFRKQAIAEKAAKPSQSIEDEIANTNTDDLFDIIDQETGQTPKPRKKTSLKGKAKETAKHTGKATKKGMEGLLAMFGAKETDTLTSGIPFNKDTWEKAKPLLDEAYQEALAAKKSFQEFVQEVVARVNESINPFLKRWVQIHKGEINDEWPEDIDKQPDNADIIIEGGGPDEQNSGIKDQTGSEAGPAEGRSTDEADQGRDAGVLEGALPEDVEGSPTGEDDAPSGGLSTSPDVGSGGTEPEGRDAVPEQSTPGAEGLADTGTGSGRAEGPGTTRDSSPGESAGGTRGVGEVTPAPVAPSRSNFHITNPSSLIGGSPKVRFGKNRDAILAYQEITDTGRNPTPKELKQIAAYTGWGSFGQELFQGTWEYPRPKEGWAKEDEWLRDHLGKKAWRSAQDSIINAHYTAPPIVTAMWKMVKAMGFDGGRVLEPSMGVGNFFGLMPKDMKETSMLTGIEMDELTGGMAQILYPEANIQVKPYQNSKTSDDFYDLVIGNWPFAQHGPADRRYNKLSPSLHDYFFLKAIDQVRPGGLVVGITSAGTMDKKARHIRLAMAKKADLIASFRLPTGAFKEYAGTAVVTDLIILQKRAEPNMAASDAGWIDTVEVPTPAGEPITVNEYIANNTKNVLGTLNYGHGTTYGRPAMIVDRLDNFETRVANLGRTVPKGIYAPVEQKSVSYVTNNTNDRQNSIIVDSKGDLKIVDGEHLLPLEDVVTHGYKTKDTAKFNKRKESIKGLVAIRQAYGKLIDAERSGSQETEKRRAELKKRYDLYVKKHGSINDSFGIGLFKKIREPFYPSLAALEVNLSNNKNKPRWTQALVLEQPTIRPKAKVVNPSIGDAFVLARNKSIRVDIEHIAEIAKKTQEEVVDELLSKGAIFKTPSGNYEVRDIYLSGNVRKKLREAQEAQKEGQDMGSNIEALEAVLPPTTPYFNIEAKLGASWVSPDYYQDFIASMLGLSENAAEKQQIKIRHTLGKWKIDFENSGFNSRPEVAVWGVPYYSFKKLVNAAFNNRPISIKYQDDDGNMVVDTALTKEVNGKADAIREHFSSWIWTDAIRQVEAETAFNETMNAIARPNFDGSFLTMEGMALQRGDEPFNLREHQLNSIWQGLVNKSGMYFHEVGTGKTYTIGGLAVESRRYGIAKKPLIFGHNANSATLAHEILEMYPGAKVLYIDNLSPDTIDIKLRQIANDDWDAIVVPHSLIDRFSLPESILTELAAEEIAALEAEALEAADADGVDMPDFDDEEGLKRLRSPTAKDLAKQRLRIISQIQKMAQRASRENAVSFDELGIDMVLVDEVHEFKKPPIATKMRMKGLATDVSTKSISLRFLTDYVKQQNGGTGIHTFTGTPITNTLTEIYKQMRYVMDLSMTRDGVKEWDQWFATFADSESDVELTSTAEYEAVTRLSNFINVPELARMVGEFASVIRAQDMPEFKSRETTTGKTLKDDNLTDEEKDFLDNGRTEDAVGRPYKKVVNVSVPMSQLQVTMLNEQIALAREFKQDSGKGRRERMLSGHPSSPILVETAVANASVDFRLYNREAPDNPNSKANKAVENILKIHGENEKTAQVIFLERGFTDSSWRTRSNGPGVPKTKIRVQKFNLVKDIVKKLVDGGIPEDQIAVVSGKTSKIKRKQIAADVKNAKIKVVIGSTSTLGVGVNMQDNLRAIHHLDAPWMPGDLEQRNGRGHRQGNKWNTVLEYRYMTDQMDGRRWQVLAVKQRFIQKFLDAVATGDSTIRVIEGDAVNDDSGGSIDDLAQSLSVAAGDPRILQKNKLQNQIRKLQERERLHSWGISDMRKKVKQVTRDIEDRKGQIIKLEEDAEALASLKEKRFSITIARKKITKRADVDDAFFAEVKNLDPGEEKQIGTYGDFKITIGWNRYSKVELSLENSLFYYGIKPTLGSIEGHLRQIPKKLEKQKEVQQSDIESLPKIKAAINTPFSRGKDLESKREALKSLEEDIQANPDPPPHWLRVGTPIDTDIYVDGKEYSVEGHKWGKEDYYVISKDDKGPLYIPYNLAKDQQGVNLYEPEGFTPPGGHAGVDSDLRIYGKRQDKPRSEKVGERVSPNRVAAETRLLFSTKGKPLGAGLTPQQIQPKLDTITKSWKNKPEVVANINKLPKGLRNYVLSVGGAAQVQGIYDPESKKVYLIANNITKGDDLKELALHEVVGHFGVEEVVRQGGGATGMELLGPCSS